MKISYSDLQKFTGKGYQTIRRRLEAAGIKPVGYGDGPGKSILWESTEALPAIYAPVKLNGSELDPQAEKARLDAARADAQEFKNAETNGRLVDAQEVIRIWTNHIVNARTKLLGVSAKIAPAVAEMTEPAKIKAEVDRLIYEVLQDLANSADIDG